MTKLLLSIVVFIPYYLIFAQIRRIHTLSETNRGLITKNTVLDEKLNSIQSWIDKISQYKLYKGCNYDKMKEIAVIKGLNDYQIELLQWKYCLEKTGVQMQRHFSRSDSSLRNHVKIAEAKFYSKPQ